MRKGLLTVLLSVVLACTVSAASLAMFDMDHPVYGRMDALYLIEGKAAPLGARPWTETDVRHMLDAVNPRTEAGRALKAEISGYLSDSDGFKAKFGASFTPVISLHANKAFDSSSDFYDRDLLNKPAADILLGMTYKNNVAALMDFSIGFDFADANVYTDDDVKDQYTSRYKENFGSNIPFVSDGKISMNFPDRTYLALGFDAFRFVLGRDRVSWGNGVMGNMMLGDTLPYHDYFSLTFTGSENFSYQMLVIFFSHSANLSNEKGDYISPDRVPLKGLRFFLGHRFEMRFFDGTFKLALNESIMYQSESGYLDFRALNPLMFLHDLYIAGNANSLATFEIEYSPIPNLSIYAQAAIDDLAMPNEKKSGEKGASVDGWGVMGGIRFSIPQDNGNYFFGNAEIVYTSPFLYHRAMEKDGKDLYYVSSNRYIVGNNVTAITRYLSFPFGSDAIAGLFRFGYDDIDLFRIEGSVFFMAHGIIDEKSVTKYYDGTFSGNPSTPSTENPFNPGENKDNNSPEYTFVLGGSGELRAASWFSVEAGVYSMLVWNKDNEPDAFEPDIQLSLGCTFRY